MDARRTFFTSRRFKSSQPLPRLAGGPFSAVLSTFALQGIALIQELIVLTLTCFNRTGVSINHFLVALLITALFNALHLK